MCTNKRQSASFWCVNFGKSSEVKFVGLTEANFGGAVHWGKRRSSLMKTQEQSDKNTGAVWYFWQPQSIFKLSEFWVDFSERRCSEDLWIWVYRSTVTASKSEAALTSKRQEIHGMYLKFISEPQSSKKWILNQEFLTCWQLKISNVKLNYNLKEASHHLQKWSCLVWDSRHSCNSKLPLTWQDDWVASFISSGSSKYTF